MTIIIILILIGIFLLIPISLSVSYEDKVNMVFRIGFIKKTLIPTKQKKAVEDKADTPKGDKPKKEKPPAPKLKLDTYIALYKALKADVFRVLGFLKDHAVTVSNLKIYITFGWDDRAAVGMAYGIISAVFYTLLGTMINELRITSWEADICPEFDTEVFGIKAQATAKIRIWHIFVIGIYALKMFIKLKKIIKAGGK